MNLYTPTPLDTCILTCTFGHYPWDDWNRAALVGGLHHELAALGRSLMREAYQHDWCERLKVECGWGDKGRAMLRRALRHPQRTAARWQWLYATDGLRVDPWDYQWLGEDSPCWKPLRRRWDRQRLAEAKKNPQPGEV